MRRPGVRRWAVLGIVGVTACGASDQPPQFQPAATPSPVAPSSSQTTTTSGPTTTTEPVDRVALDATWELSGEWLISGPGEIDTAAVHGYAHMNVAADGSRHMGVSHDNCSWFSGDVLIANGSTTVVPIEGADTGAIECPRVDKSLTFENTVECLRSGCRFALDGTVLRLSDIDGIRVADLIAAPIEPPIDPAASTTTTTTTTTTVTIDSNDFSTVASDLADAEARWAAAGISEYELTIAEDRNYWNAGCVWTVDVAERVGTQVSVAGQSTGGECGEVDWTVERLHDLIARFLAAVERQTGDGIGADMLDVVFDQHGVPTSIEFDLANGADEESSMQITLTQTP